MESHLSQIIIYLFFSFQQEDILFDFFFFSTKRHFRIEIEYIMNIYIYWYISWLLDNIFYTFIGCTVIDYFHISYLFLRQKRSISCKVQFLTTYTISASEFEPRSWQGALDTTLCEKVCQWLAADQWFSRVLRFPPPINLATTNNWNIIESGIKHHNPIPTWF